MSRKKIDIIIPVFNEGENIERIYEALESVCSGLAAYDASVIFVNDGSSDDSGQRIATLARQHAQVNYIELSRNFGKEAATTAGLHHSQGEAAIMMDCDLQHPPELIPEFLQKWESGAEVVIGIRDNNASESIFKKIGSSCFYRIMKWIGETKLVPHSTDYRLLDRRVVDEFKHFNEHNRITRGLIDWLGFRQDYVHFQARERSSGQAAYGKLKLIKLALSSFVAHSLFPLKFAGYLGMFTTLLSGSLGLYILVRKYLIRDSWGLSITGSASLAVMIIFMIGIVLSCLGLIALYIAQIQIETKARPLYVIRKKKI